MRPTYVVTGANTGIGKMTALELARRDARVILACRSPARAVPVVEELKAATGNAAIELVTVDLADFSSVRACAAELLARGEPIHGLINNAGHVARGLTKDGFELIFGTNHLGHYLLTRLLLPLLEQSSARVVNVSSDAHFQVKRLDWEALRRPTATAIAVREYEVSKLANVLFTRELARRAQRVTTYAVHPGRVATDVWRRIPQPFRAISGLFMISPEAGARSSVVAATSDALTGHSGRYYDEQGREKSPSPLAQDPALAAQLWHRSAEWTGLPADGGLS